MSELRDFLDALLTECFSESIHSCPQPSVLSSVASSEDSVPVSVLDFDLSLLVPSSASLPATSVEFALFVPRRDST